MENLATLRDCKNSPRGNNSFCIVMKNFFPYEIAFFPSRGEQKMWMMLKHDPEKC